MADLLDIEQFSDDNKFVIVGEIDECKAVFLREKSPGNNLFNGIKGKRILLLANRIEYTEKHKGNFQTADEYYECLKNITNIIDNPDYLGLPPHDDSIQFIKRMGRAIIVAVRISNKGNLSYRTMYPITDSQLNDYLRKNRAWKFDK